MPGTYRHQTGNIDEHASAKVLDLSSSNLRQNCDQSFEAANDKGDFVSSHNGLLDDRLTPEEEVAGTHQEVGQDTLPYSVREQNDASHVCPNLVGRHWSTQFAFGRHRRTRCIAPDDRAEVLRAWAFSQTNPDLALNHMLTLRPAIDHLDPEQRVAHWDRVRRDLVRTCNQVGKRFGIKWRFTAIMSRESVNDRGDHEHLHVLLHVPPKVLAAFRSIISKWPGDNDLKAASYNDRWVKVGRQWKRKSAVGYMLKSAAPRDIRRDRTIWYRARDDGGGVVFGWRTKTTLDLAPAARRRATAAGVVAAAPSLMIVPDDLAEPEYSSPARIDHQRGQPPIPMTTTDRDDRREFARLHAGRSTLPLRSADGPELKGAGAGGHIRSEDACQPPFDKRNEIIYNR